MPHQTLRVQRARAKRALKQGRIQKRRRRHKNRHRGFITLSGQRRTALNSKGRKHVEIFLPPSFCLDEDYEAAVRILKIVRRASNKVIRLRSLVFDQLRFISPAAALLLASEVDRWNDSVSGSLTAAHHQWDPQIKRLLSEMGFFELLGIPRPQDCVQVKNTQFLPFIRGNTSRKDEGGRLAKELREKIEKTAGVEVQKHLLFMGLTEAITNVSQHAYSRDHDEKLRKWWMFAAFDRETRVVTVCFYDHGRTIPGTLPASHLFEQMKLFFYSWSDAEKIEAAMRVGRSSTRLSQRGKGLQDFLALIDGVRGGVLDIFSGRGMLRVSPAGNGKFDYKRKSHARRLDGTLIQWQFLAEIT